MNDVWEYALLAPRRASSTCKRGMFSNVEGPLLVTCSHPFSNVEGLVSEESLHFLLAYLAFLLMVLPPPSPAVQFCEALLSTPSLDLRGKRWLTPSPFHERLIQ